MQTLFSPDTQTHIHGTVYYETDTYISVTDGNRQVGGPKREVMPTVKHDGRLYYAECPCGWQGSKKTLRSAVIGDIAYHGR